MTSTETLINNILANHAQAQEDRKEHNTKRELRHLLFIVSDISTILKRRNNELWWDNSQTGRATAQEYAEMSRRAAERIEILVDERA